MRRREDDDEEGTEDQGGDGSSAPPKKRSRLEGTGDPSGGRDGLSPTTGALMCAESVEDEEDPYDAGFDDDEDDDDDDDDDEDDDDDDVDDDDVDDDDDDVDDDEELDGDLPTPEEEAAEIARELAYRQQERGEDRFYASNETLFFLVLTFPSCLYPRNERTTTPAVLQSFSAALRRVSTLATEKRGGIPPFR